MRQFIQIGQHIINANDIVRVCISGNKLEVITRDLEGNYEGYPCSSYKVVFLVDSPQGKALLQWLNEHSEVLMPYSDEPSNIDD